ncbi:PaREP1/PaREP8 domain-contain protein [Candidatus Bathyarchaeota archaeon]|nr:MAG: PaREP1/PaREP8 domain-contain protein [Candidatus Bathyarchaeota archaeon]
MAIMIPRKLADLVSEEARRRGIPLEQLLVEKLASGADPSVRVQAYLELHEKYLEEARALADKGDFAQVGEKLWGAVTALLNAIGELRRLPHYSHRDYSELIEQLASEFRKPELGRLFAVAERLHASFYHGFIKDPEAFRAYEADVIKLMEVLKSEISRHLAAPGETG